MEWFLYGKNFCHERVKEHQKAGAAKTSCREYLRDLTRANKRVSYNLRAVLEN